MTLTDPPPLKPDWFTRTVTSLAAVIFAAAIGRFLMNSVQWMQNWVQPTNTGDPLIYKLHVLHVYSAMIKRSIALFAAFTLLLLGLGASFFSLQRMTNIGADTPGGVKVRLATASPGIVAMVLGTSLIIFATNSKDQFPNYPGESGGRLRSVVGLQTSEQPLDQDELDQLDALNPQPGVSGIGPKDPPASQNDEADGLEQTHTDQ